MASGLADGQMYLHNYNNNNCLFSPKLQIDTYVTYKEFICKRSDHKASLPQTIFRSNSKFNEIL